MMTHTDIDAVSLREKISNRSIQFAGHRKLKIYGTLDCASGKRMHRGNRVFFTSADEAIQLGFRPCGHCMKEAYRQWISLNN